MSTKINLALAAVLVIASTSATLAASARRSYDASPGWSGGAYGGFVPGSKAEHDWFARASRPSNL
jgi:hypothetical protein